MAKRLNYTIGVEADTSKLEAQLNKAYQSLTKIGNSQQITTNLQKASSSALELANNLSKAVNQNTGKLDLSVFNNNLKRSGQTLNSYYNQLVQLGPAGQDAFLQVASAVVQAELPIKRTSKLLDSLWITMKNTMRWQLTSSVLHGFTGALEQAYGYAKSLDSSLNNIRIVSNKSADDMARFAEQANKAAKALSTTTTDYTDASLIYYQQGLTDQEVLNRTETTIKMANVAGTTAETASQQLTAIWNNFYDGSQSLEHYADVMVKLGAATASSSDEISEGIEKFAAVANTVGLSYEYAASALATVTAQTRESASIVGTAFRTLFSRIQGLTQGETLDDGTTLNKYSEALAKVGVNIKDTDGELKDMDEILDDLGGKWNSLAQDQKIALAETVTGVRQWTQLIALMDNYDFFKENLALANNANGTLEKQAKIYAESWEAARDRTKAAAEDIYDSLINPDFYIEVDNLVTPILSGTAEIIDSLGGLKGVLLVAASAMTVLYGDKMAEGIRSMAHNIGVMTGYEQIKARMLQQEAASLTDEIAGTDTKYQLESKMMDLRHQANVESDYLNTHQKELLQADIDDLEVLRQKTNELLKQKEASESLVRSRVNAISSGMGAGAADLNPQTKVTPKESKYISKIFSNYQAGGNQITQQKTAVAALAQEYKKVSEQISRVNIIMGAFERNGQKLGKTRLDVKTMGEDFKRTGENIGLFSTKLSKNEHIEKMGKAYTNLMAKHTLLRNEIEARGGNTNYLEELDFDVQELIKNLAAAGVSEEDFENKIKKVTKAINNQGYRAEATADKIVKIGQLVGKGLMALQAIKNLGRVFSDEDMTAGDRLIAIFTSLSMILPLVGEATKGLTAALKAQNIASLVAEGLADESKLSNIENVVLRTIVTKIVKKQKAAINEHTAALGTEAIAQDIVNSSLLTLLGYAALAVAAVVAISAAIYLLVKAYNADADAAKEAAAGVETLTKNYEDAKNAASELKETINNWDEAVKSLDDLKQGTNEYKEALKKANDQAKELIETYGLYRDYYTENGVIKFNDGVLDRIQEEANIRESQAESALYSGKILSNNANLKSERTNVIRSTGIPYYQLDQALELQKSSQENPISDEEFLKRIKDLVPYLDLTITDVKDVRTALQQLMDATDKATEANKYYAKNVLGNDIEENRGDFLNTIAGDNEGLKQQVIDAYAARENQYLEEQNKALSNLTVAATDYSSNSALGNFINQSIDGDEELAKLYASMVLHRTDVDQLSYKGGWNKSSLQTGSGEEVFTDMSDDYMRKAIAQAYAQQQLLQQLKESSDGFDQEAYEASLTKLVKGADALGETFGNIDFTSAILNSMAQGDETLDLSTLFTQLSPDDINRLIADDSKEEIINKLGLTEDDFDNLGYTDADAWWKSFQEGLSGYDPTVYWKALTESSKKNAEDIGGILASYQNDEELSEEQIAILDKLGEKYSNLNELREQGGHEYLQTLREIQEQEEESSITALKNLKQTQQEKADALQQEIDELKIKQKNAKSERSQDRLQVQIDAKTEEFDKVINDILDTNYQIDIAVNADLKSDIDQAFGLADELQKIQGYLSDGLEISFDRAQEIIEAGYGAMLTNAQETANNTIKLNQDVVNKFIDGKQSEINADKESKIKQLETERILLVNKQKSLQAGIDALNTGLNAADNTAKAEALIQASKYKAQADAAETTAEQEADAADQSNNEIATDAENLVNALGIMHETNAENSQQAYHDAEIAANDSAKSQINALNQIQKAAVAYSDAVRDAPNGAAVFNPVIFNGLSNVTVGATGSKNADNTYDLTEADVNISTEDILEAANNNKEVLQSALEKAKEELVAYKALVDAQVGANDAAQAALNSADLSLDKIQSGLGGSGSGNTSKTYNKEDLKTLEEVEDRYHDINRQIERQKELLDDLEEAANRAWGPEALKKYGLELNVLEKQQELYLEKEKKAKEFLYDEAELVQSYFNEAKIDTQGEISNYEDLLKKNLQLYNAAVERYNLAIDGKELSEEEYNALKEELDKEKSLFDARANALKQYETTLDVVRDITNDIQENVRELADKKLEMIKLKMEIVLDVKSMRDTVRDLYKEIAEMFGDALTHGLESAKLSAQSAQAEAALLPDYQEKWESLRALYESTTDEADRKSIMEEIKSLQSNIADSAKAIAEWVNSIEDLIPEAISAASERFAMFTNQLEHNNSILSTIKELYALQGVTYKTQDGFNKLLVNAQERLNAQLASSELQKGWYEEAKAKLEEAQARLDSLGDDEKDLRYDTYKKARDAYLEEFNQAQEAYLSQAQAAMKTAKDIYLQEIERAAYLFGQAITDNVGLDLLQDKYNHYIETEERYFDKVNEAYQVAAWYNKLQQDIDNTTNSVYKNRLKALQEEINARKEGNKLSQYDLDILDAKYQLLQAQQALEEAQNNKNKIQLVRDSQGNWNYQYSTDQDEIAKAEQGVLDAQNNWYNIAKKRTKETAGEIVSMWQECTEAIEQLYTDLANGEITEEEYLRKKTEIEQYYTEKAKYLEEEKNIAIKDMNEAGYESLKEIAEKSGETVEDFENTYAEELGTMTETNKNFAKYLNEYLSQCKKGFDEYQQTVSAVAGRTGTDLDNLAEETDKVSAATDQLRDKGLEAKDSLWEMVTAADQAAESYLHLADAVWKAVEAMKKMTGDQADFVESKTQPDNTSYDKNTDYTAMIQQGLVNGWISYGDETFTRLYGQLENKVYKEQIDYTGGKESFMGYHEGDTLTGWGASRYNTKEEWFENLENLKKNYGLSTGGYTGIFDDAKLAFLHQKELVLNQSDTENILAAVQAVRTISTDLFKSIEKSLDGNVIAAMALMGQKLNPVATAPIQDSIEQTVHIDKVEFPNVTSRTEIEEAFISLTNDAAQWARRKS